MSPFLVVLFLCLHPLDVGQHRQIASPFCCELGIQLLLPKPCIQYGLEPAAAVDAVDGNPVENLSPCQSQSVNPAPVPVCMPDEMDELVENGELMKASVTGDKLIRYNFKDGDRVMAFTTLRNGMKLVLCDSYESIFDERNQLANIMIIVSFALAVIFAAVAA